MKLAEALQERADLNQIIENLKIRLINNVIVQDGEETAENPEQLKKELDNCIKRLEYLIKQINITNSQTKLDDESLTSIIAKKDTLNLKINLYKIISTEASQNTYRARNTEIKIKSNINVAKWQKEIDVLSKELRQLDNKLQQTNWTIDLIE